jgi:hypothetical protein
MSRRILSYVAVALFSMVLTTIAQPLSYLEALAQQSRCQTFKETGKTVCGTFLEYWQKNGGLAQQGFPITGLFSEVSDLDAKTYTVQYFERAVFEFHPENKPPFDVLLSQLGTFRLRERYAGGVPTPAAGAPGAIMGKLAYPAEAVPALQVYAIEVAGPNVYSVRTNFNQQTFTISGIAAGAYYVVAYWDSAPTMAGGYSQYVLCGLSARCTDHSLVPVVVAPGETVQGVRVEDWYAKPGTFPTRPGGQPAPTPSTGALLYMWPRQIPGGLVVQKERSSAGERMFVLELVDPTGGQFNATITGGPDSIAARPPTRGTTSVAVRGRQGLAFTTGAGYSVFWSENGQPYAITGGLGRDAVLSMAESLEPLDIAAWLKRLEAIP